MLPSVRLFFFHLPSSSQSPGLFPGPLKKERRQKTITDAEEQGFREFLCVLGSYKRLQCTSAKLFVEGFTTCW